MTRLNVLLLLVVVMAALGVVTSQHQARKLFVELQKEKQREQRMDVEWGQLQLERSTLLTPARIEAVAARQLRMQAPNTQQVRYIKSEGGSAISP